MGTHCAGAVTASSPRVRGDRRYADRASATPPFTDGHWLPAHGWISQLPAGPGGRIGLCRRDAQHLRLRSGRLHTIVKVARPTQMPDYPADTGPATTWEHARRRGKRAVANHIRRCYRHLVEVTQRVSRDRTPGERTPMRVVAKSMLPRDAGHLALRCDVYSGLQKH